MHLGSVVGCADAPLVLSVLDLPGAVGTRHGTTVFFRVLSLRPILLTLSEVSNALTACRVLYLATCRAPELWTGFDPLSKGQLARKSYGLRTTDFSQILFNA